MPQTHTHALRGSPISLDSAAESQLVHQVAAGSSDALAALYRVHAAPLFRLARRMTSSVEDAEDVLHDLFVGLPESIHKYHERGSLQGWLKRVVVRLALMRLRATRRRREVALDEGVSTPSAPQAVDNAVDWDVQRAIETLPDDLRAVLVLRQGEQYTHQEIAAMLGITPGASRARLSRAVKRMRTALRGRT
jgi:RNA polymerase sigma-70 factor (ECF subfamily)